MAANYTKRDIRGEEIRKALDEHANVRDVPSLFRCAVCGVEWSPTVPIMHLSAGINSAFHCEAHVPAEWR